MMRRDGKRRLDPRRVSLAKAPKDHLHLGLCLNYTGSAFRGLQLQAHGPTAHTVEGTLLQAMRDAGLIAAVVRGRPEGDQHHFARSCRTDRGVHAVRNLISIFVPQSIVEGMGGLEGVRSRVNAELPAMVRVASVMLLSGNFVPRHCCNRRVYRYMLPLYALLAPCDTWAALDKTYPDCLRQLHAMAKASAADQRTVYGVPYVDVSDLEGAAAAVADGGEAASWVRDTQAKVAACNDILSTYFTLSRRYHNFSVDIDSNRSSVNAKVVQPDTDEALRVIYRCEVLPRLFFFPCASAAGGETTPLHGSSRAEYESNLKYARPTQSDGESADTATAATAAPLVSPLLRNPAASPPAGTTVLPFVFFQIEGGSFLLNMIRKMVGSLLAVCRGARPSILDDALNPERRVTTPLAPGPYLYLAQSTYHGYNRSLVAKAGTRLLTVQDAWAGGADEAAEAFAFRDIAADVVDADLNALPPLDDALAARDVALRCRRPHTAEEDAHLVEMKEYKAVVPTRTAWPACSEMTVFLRLLRVHNWNVRPIRLDPNCKALKEQRNREEKRETPAAQQQQPATVDGEGTSPAAAADAVDEAAVPDGGADGWLYLAHSPEDAVAQRQAYFASRWKRARPWEYAAAEADVGGEDDADDDDCGHQAGGGAAHSRKRHRQ